VRGKGREGKGGGEGREREGGHPQGLVDTPMFKILQNTLATIGCGDTGEYRNMSDGVVAINFSHTRRDSESLFVAVYCPRVENVKKIEGLSPKLWFIIKMVHL